VGLRGPNKKVLSVSLKFHQVTRPNAHMEANLAWQGDSPSRRHLGLHLYWRAFVSHFFHVVYFSLNWIGLILKLSIHA
jgi:hypothetical protein